MKVFIKLTVDEKNLLGDALKQYSTFISSLIVQREGETGKDSVTELLTNTLKKTDALYSDFIKL